MSIFRKRFKSAKCKALLKLVLIRINVARKKHEIQLKHMRQDVSRFLQIGQYENAQTRVAYVIREQNVLDAFNILESFCERIIKQMPILRAQKACPKDLLEAVSSLLFAGPRCAKLPELVKVRKIFAGKYGKDFVATTLEPNNSSGVSKVIIEKLSSSNSIKETQVKHIMQEIALEYGIKWNSTALDPELGRERGDCDGRNRSEDKITDSIPETVGPIAGSESSLLTSILQAKESFSLPPSSSCDDEDDAHFDGKNQFIVSVMRIRTLVASHCESTSHDALQGRVNSCDQHMQHSDRTFSQKQQQEVVDASRDNFIEDFNILRTGTEGHIPYTDVVSAAETAAISADHAVAATKIAARLAMNALSQKALISDAETDTGEDDLICGPTTRIIQPNFQIPLQSQTCYPVKIYVQIDPDPQQQAVVQSTSLSSNIFCDGSSSSCPIIDPGIKNKSSDGKTKINGCAELANEEYPAWNDNAGTTSSSKTNSQRAAHQRCEFITSLKPFEPGYRYHHAQRNGFLSNPGPKETYVSHSIPMSNQNSNSPRSRASKFVAGAEKSGFCLANVQLNDICQNISKQKTCQDFSTEQTRRQENTKIHPVTSIPRIVSSKKMSKRSHFYVTMHSCLFC